jgi:hypothetical protein
MLGVIMQKITVEMIDHKRLDSLMLVNFLSMFFAFWKNMNVMNLIMVMTIKNMAQIEISTNKYLFIFTNLFLIRISVLTKDKKKTKISRAKQAISIV